VHGPNPAHGLGLSGMAACGVGCTGLLARLGPPKEAGRAQRRGHRAVATRVAALWRYRHRLSGGPSTARSWARAPQLSGGCAGQGERRRGSPTAAVDCEAGWRLGAAGAAGSSPVGGSAASSWSCGGGRKR
jgi:hypothetical protein